MLLPCDGFLLVHSQLATIGGERMRNLFAVIDAFCIDRVAGLSPGRT